MQQTACAGMISPSCGQRDAPMGIGLGEPATDEQAVDATEVLSEVRAKCVPPTPLVVGASLLVSARIIRAGLSLRHLHPPICNCPRTSTARRDVLGQLHLSAWLFILKGVEPLFHLVEPLFHMLQHLAHLPHISEDLGVPLDGLV
jgi:hypothetical protein